MKTVWVTAFTREGDLTQQTMAELQGYGLAAEGHFWIDDPKSLAWMPVREEMEKKRPALWLILASSKVLAEPNLRYGLSILSLAARAHLGSIPTAFLSASGESLTTENLPAVLSDSVRLSPETPAWQAKLVALANRQASAATPDYYFDVFGDRQVGQWFEVGPVSDGWNGALLAVAGADIDFHAVGLRGKLPERCTLSYEQKGLKLDASGIEHTGWAVRNTIAVTESYFLRVRGEPSSILFGSYPEGDAAEFFSLRLK
jgi:hypothetical protein